MLFRGSASIGEALGELAPLTLDALTRCRELGVTSDTDSAPCLALVDGSDERLLLGVEICDGAVQRRSALPRLVELRTAGTELSLCVREQLLPLRCFHLRLRARFLEPLSLQPRIGQRFGELLDAARRRLGAFAQTLDLVAAGEDAHLRIVAAIHAQPVTTDPDTL